jgi:hypothetical protein
MPKPQASKLIYLKFDDKTNKLKLSVFFSELLFQNLAHRISRQ